MKKSSLILLVSLGVIVIFFFALQLSIHSYLKEEAVLDEKYKDVNDITAETRKVSDFKKIAVSHGIKVLFKQDSVKNIKVEASKKLISYIKTEVINEKLVIEKTERIKKNDSITVFVQNSILDSLIVSSGANFETIENVSGAGLKIEFNDDSIGNLELSYTSVKCKASSDAKVNLKGNSKEIEFSN